MALPVTISGVNIGATHENPFNGPFMSSGGNYYGVFLDNTDRSLVEVWKATDPTSSFAEQDSADKPNLTNLIEAYNVHQEADVLHIATQEDVTGRVGYHTFNMATDQWVIVNETVVTPANNPTDYAVDISVRSDGDVIVLYQGARDTITMNNYTRVKYARRESAVWTVNVAVDNASSINWADARIVRGSSDRMHFFFKDHTNDDAYQRTLTSANALQTFPSAFDSAIDGMQFPFMRGVSYESGGATKVRMPYVDSSINGSMAKFDSADTPSITVDVDFTATDIDNNTESAIGSAAVQGTKLYFVWASAVDADLDYDVNNNDGGWGTDQAAVNTIAADCVSANVYVRSGNYRLAMFYQNSGVMTYNEVDLGAAGASATGTPSLSGLTASASASHAQSATGSPTLPQLVALSSATHQQIASAITTLQALTAAGSADSIFEIPGSGTVVLQQLAALSNAIHEQIANGAPSLAQLIAISNALMLLSATGSTTLPQLTALAIALHSQLATGAPTLPQLTAAGAGVRKPTITDVTPDFVFTGGSIVIDGAGFD